MENKNFAKGMIVKKNDNAPSFVIANVSFNVKEFTEWLNANQSNGWVNVQMKVSQNGKPYAELDTWKPKEKQDLDF